MTWLQWYVFEPFCIFLGKEKGYVLNEYKHNFSPLPGATCKVISIAFTVASFFLYKPPPVQTSDSQKNIETETSVQL